MAAVLTSFLFPFLFLSVCWKLCPLILIVLIALEYFIVIASFEDEEVYEDLPDT